MSETISVIIPVYKVEAYLEACVASVRAQTYSALEIILVDDGSPDRCGEICDRLAREDPRIRVVHRKNGGLSAARNSGLDISTGQYIFFLDSDDALEPDCLARMREAIEAEGADLAVCSLRYTYENGEAPSEPLPVGAGTFDGRELLEKLCRGESVVYVVAWNRLYRRYLWEEARFPEGKYFEDEYVAHELYGQARRVVVLPDGFYLYLKQRSGSITGSVSFAKLLAQAEPFAVRCGYLWDRGETELWVVTYRRFLHYYLTALGSGRPQTEEDRTLLKKTAEMGRALLRAGRPVTGRSERLALRCPALWQRLKRVR